MDIEWRKWCAEQTGNLSYWDQNNGKKKKKKKWDNGEMNGNDVRLQESMNTGLSETGMCRFFFFFQVSQ